MSKNITLRHKLDPYSAHKLATGIAMAAFGSEHNTAEDAVKKATAALYNSYMDDIVRSPQLNQLVRCGLLIHKDLSHCQVVPIRVRMESNDNNSLQTIMIECGHDYVPTSNLNLIADDKTYANLESLHSALQEVRSRIQSLIDELSIQASGKTLKNVLKLWPDAEPIAKAIWNIREHNMEVPLENIIRRYMKALPSPESAVEKAASNA